jgi:methylenetetrahydrofolate--tRNA-(uracil-5-)-methyltransferase
MLSQSLAGRRPAPPPASTALGGVVTHLTRATDSFQPSNVTWAWLSPLEGRRLPKRERYDALAQRALVDLAQWLAGTPLAALGRDSAGSVSDRRPAAAHSI